MVCNAASTTLGVSVDSVWQCSWTKTVKFMLFWDGKALNTLEQGVQGLSHWKPLHSAQPFSWTMYLVLPHTFSLKPGQPPLFALCGVLDCEWWIEGSAGRNVLLSNVVVVCVYNHSVFWLYKLSSGCMRGTTFCSYLLVSLSLSFFIFFLSFSSSRTLHGEWWICLFVYWYRLSVFIRSYTVKSHQLPDLQN